MPAARAASAAIFAAFAGLAQTPTSISYEKEVKPVITRYCVSCHNEKLASGKLNLDSFHDASAAQNASTVWEKVIDKVAARRMPPPGLPFPKPEEFAVIRKWVEG